MKNNEIFIKNRKASFQYFLEDQFTVGMILQGTEIKSIRMGKASLEEAYCLMQKGKLFVRNLHIAEYPHGNRNNHEPMRPRELLLTKREMKKISAKVKERGYTIIPVSLFVNDRGWAKMDIALARGKKMFDKRQSIKQKENKRQLDRVMKGFRN